MAITYENEVLVGQQSGQDYDLVIPRSTILIENPVAVIDTYVDKHGTREVAEAFVEFLFTSEAQEIFAKYGLRSVDPKSPKQPPASTRRWKTSSPSITSAAGTKPPRTSSATTASTTRQSPKSSRLVNSATNGWFWKGGER